MLYKTAGIILHTTSYSENSLIAKIFTKDFGLQSYIINGIRNKKSKNKANIFQPLSIVDLIVSNSEKSTLHRISEINILYPYSDIPYSINKSAIALFLNEVLYKAINTDHPDEDLFEFIKESLIKLDLMLDNFTNFHLCFMIKLSRFLGFSPQENFSEQYSIFDLKEGLFLNYLPNHPFYVNQEISGNLNTLLTLEYDDVHLLKLDRTRRKEILQTLIDFYQIHISSFRDMKSHQVLEEVNY